jgi:hypothetical protein
MDDLHKIESPSLRLLTAAYTSLDLLQESTLHPQDIKSFYDTRDRRRRNLASITPFLTDLPQSFLSSGLRKDEVLCNITQGLAQPFITIALLRETRADRWNM